ncbi:hypothetical protein [Caballeronia sp. LZ034LL]|uniref:hypothetical protein n=1 Tax=Caballeronia sp. LZ034LL TaxID=3038567 RepID=UPI00286C9B34|nr:hypothetical protein [Caballeronia sp. LZ034LL]
MKHGDIARLDDFASHAGRQTVGLAADEVIDPGNAQRCIVKAAQRIQRPDYFLDATHIAHPCVECRAQAVERLAELRRQDAGKLLTKVNDDARPFKQGALCFTLDVLKLAAKLLGHREVRQNFLQFPDAAFDPDPERFRPQIVVENTDGNQIVQPRFPMRAAPADRFDVLESSGSMVIAVEKTLGDSRCHSGNDFARNR